MFLSIIIAIYRYLCYESAQKHNCIIVGLELSKGFKTQEPRNDQLKEASIYRVFSVFFFLSFFLDLSNKMHELGLKENAVIVK